VRLLFLSSEHAATQGTGGVGTYVATISAAMARRGHEVHVLSCRERVAPSDELVDGVWMHVRPLANVKGLRLVWRGWHSRRRAMLVWSNYRAAKQLGRFDVIEAPDWQAEGLLVGLRRLAPLVVHIHTPHQVLRFYESGQQTVDDRVCNWMERLAARRSSAITSPSQLAVDRLRADGWLGDQAVEIIRYPVDTARFGAVGPARATAQVLAVGRLERRKSPELLIEAAALLKQRGVDVEIQLVGRGSGDRDGLPYAEWVRREAQRLGIDWDRPHELSWTEVTQAYEDAQVVCVCSQFESFSMAAVEGMAAGRPVIATPGIGAAEVLTSEPSQRLPDSKVETIAAAIGRYVDDPGLVAAHGAANRRDVEAQCDPDEVAKQREELFARLSESGARRGP
jgi:glycosyltransferase involved in cell wall biosynthesis